MMATLIWDVSYAARTKGNGWWFMNSYPLRCSGKVSDMPADLIVELLGQLTPPRRTRHGPLVSLPLSAILTLTLTLTLALTLTLGMEKTCTLSA